VVVDAAVVAVADVVVRAQGVVAEHPVVRVVVRAVKVRAAAAAEADARARAVTVMADAAMVAASSSRT
jgi:hypothetical protein